MHSVSTFFNLEAKFNNYSDKIKTLFHHFIKPANKVAYVSCPVLMESFQMTAVFFINDTNVSETNS